MIRQILNSPLFNIAFSFLLGIGIVAILRPMCKDSTGQYTECKVDKAPPVKDWNDTVYRIGSKCYEFKTQTIECPKDKTQYIESFKSQFQQRESLIQRVP
jgi:hypothetical protein